jgi:hypothetical protein
MEYFTFERLFILSYFIFTSHTKIETTFPTEKSYAVNLTNIDGATFFGICHTKHLVSLVPHDVPNINKIT